LYETRRPRYMVGTLRIETAGKNVDAVAVEEAKLLGIGEDRESARSSE
jgi:hypothetical protein